MVSSSEVSQWAKAAERIAERFGTGGNAAPPELSNLD